mmetsp:Transcript_34114/g.53296  ORF Transcript_34114/g.53296 Transcript_34114/m.53296 type:complete len:84 (+) Transcript_34114:413-664(+)
MRCCGGLKSERQRQQRRGRSRALKATVRRVKGALAKEVERPAGLNLQATDLNGLKYISGKNWLLECKGKGAVSSPCSRTTRGR